MVNFGILQSQLSRKSYFARYTIIVDIQSFTEAIVEKKN
jgi:hypothetical protein